MTLKFLLHICFLVILHNIHIMIVIGYMFMDLVLHLEVALRSEKKEWKCYSHHQIQLEHLLRYLV